MPTQLRIDDIPFAYSTGRRTCVSESFDSTISCICVGPGSSVFTVVGNVKVSVEAVYDDEKSNLDDALVESQGYSSDENEVVEVDPAMVPLPGSAGVSQLNLLTLPYLPIH